MHVNGREVSAFRPQRRGENLPSSGYPGFCELSGIGTNLCGLRTRVPRMIGVLNLVRTFARVDAPVLIEGETGAGKEVLARALHEMGDRASKPFVAVDCGGLPDSLIEAELFGYERSAFTGADRAYSGRIEAAAGGTLFLDEVNSISLPVQAKLLRFLDRRQIMRIGCTAPIEVDVRIVSASNVPICQLVRENRTRADFFHRLNVLRLDVPPLRERVDDIELLVAQFLEEDPLARRFDATCISEESMEVLRRHAWPGNVRELFNVLRRSVVSGVEDGVLMHLDLPGYQNESAADEPQMAEVEPSMASPQTDVAAAASRDSAMCFREWMKAREDEYLRYLIHRYRTTAERAMASGLPQRTLYRKLRALREA